MKGAFYSEIWTILPATIGAFLPDVHAGDGALFYYILGYTVAGRTAPCPAGAARPDGSPR